MKWENCKITTTTALPHIESQCFTGVKVDPNVKRVDVPHLADLSGTNTVKVVKVEKEKNEVE